MCLIKGCICWWKEYWCYQNARYNKKKRFQLYLYLFLNPSIGQYQKNLMKKLYLTSYRNIRTFVQCKGPRGVFFCLPDSQFVIVVFSVFLYTELNRQYGWALQVSVQCSGVMNDATLRNENSMTCEKSRLAQNLTHFLSQTRSLLEITYK